MGRGRRVVREGARVMCVPEPEAEPEATGGKGDAERVPTALPPAPPLGPAGHTALIGVRARRRVGIVSRSAAAFAEGVEGRAGGTSASARPSVVLAIVRVCAWEDLAREEAVGASYRVELDCGLSPAAPEPDA